VTHPPATYPVELVETRPTHELVRSERIRPEAMTEDIGAAMIRLYHALAASHLNPAGPPHLTYLTPFTDDRPIDVELAVAVEQVVATDDPVIDRPRRTVARTLHTGPYDEIGAAHGALWDWIAEAGYRAVGPVTETYLTGPEQTDDAPLTELSVPVARRLGVTVELDEDVPTALARVREALRDNGFGVLTEIDVRATMRARLGDEVGDMEDYVILGACNPGLARRGLDIDRQLGLLLPCNVVVRADGDRTVVEALDPQALVSFTGIAELGQVADEAATSLTAALGSLRPA